jgi:hypothetical protein
MFPFNLYRGRRMGWKETWMTFWFFITFRRICYDCWGTGVKTKHNYEHDCPLCDGRKWILPNWRYGGMVNNVRRCVKKLSGGNNGSA